jgi:hypothetical protein
VFVIPRVYLGGPLIFDDLSSVKTPADIVVGAHTIQEALLGPSQQLYADLHKIMPASGLLVSKRHCRTAACILNLSPLCCILVKVVENAGHFLPMEIPGWFGRYVSQQALLLLSKNFAARL